MLESIGTIIVATDFSELSETAVRSAASLAAKDDATVHLLHVIRLPFVHTTYDVNVPKAVWEGIREGTLERMAESRQILEQAGVSDVKLIVSEYLPPAQEITKAAGELDADLVIMATHGHGGLKHAFLGSVTERTLRTSPVPVLAIKGKGITSRPIQRILLPTDFSEHSTEATALACSLAKRYGAHIDVVHVLSETPGYVAFSSAETLEYEKQGRAMAGDSLEAVGDDVRDASLSAKTHLCKGVAADVIVEAANRLGSDLIVMGTHGFTGFAHAVIGSVAERTLRLAPCSVLTTHAAKGEGDSGGLKID
jgi:nucleotide-binding universal stress UspA family protein